jgi:2-alkyl-3-oxoalkanoate reductase
LTGADDALFVARASGAIGEPLIAELLKRGHEARLFGSNAIEGVALRYGFFYGPKTWYYPGDSAANMVVRQQVPVVGKGEGVSSFVHINDAAAATVAALTAEAGVYNVVDDDPSPQNVWPPAFASFVGASPPPHMGEAEARAIAGEDAVY